MSLSTRVLTIHRAYCERLGSQALDLDTFVDYFCQSIGDTECLGFEDLSREDIACLYDELVFCDAA